MLTPQYIQRFHPAPIRKVVVRQNELWSMSEKRLLKGRRILQDNDANVKAAFPQRS
jgi:hypothetical protein